MGRGRLLDCAIDEFAAKGLDGASTRGIAAAAGTAMSAITYHYGGKEGLYLAAADHIAATMEDLPLELGTDAIVFAGDAGRARGAIKAILARMVDRLAGEQSENWSLFLVREQMHPTEGFDRIYAGPMGRMVEALVALVKVATGAGDRTAQIAVMTLLGQVLVLRAARATCTRMTGGDCAEAGFVAAYRARVAANTDAILQSMTDREQA